MRRRPGSRGATGRRWLFSCVVKWGGGGGSGGPTHPICALVSIAAHARAVPSSEDGTRRAAGGPDPQGEPRGGGDGSARLAAATPVSPARSWGAQGLSCAAAWGSAAGRPGAGGRDSESSSESRGRGRSAAARVGSGDEAGRRRRVASEGLPKRRFPGRPRTTPREPGGSAARPSRPLCSPRRLPGPSQSVPLRDPGTSCP